MIGGFLIGAFVAAVVMLYVFTKPLSPSTVDEWAALLARLR